MNDLVVPADLVRDEGSVHFGGKALALVLHNINFAIFDNAFGVCLWHFPF